MTDWILRRARFISSPETKDLLVQDGKISFLPGKKGRFSARELDLEGRLVIPGFVDAHLHLDKAFALEHGLRPANTLPEAVKAFYTWQKEMTPRQVYENARRVAETALLHGTIALRTHVTLDQETGFTWLEALARVKQDMAGKQVVQVVAFLDSAELQPGKSLTWFRQALERGADLIGGAPAVSDNPQQSVDLLIEAAGETDSGLDLHVDESDDPATRTLEYLADRLLALDFRQPVTAGHCCSLSAIPEDIAGRIIDKVVEAKINIITLPSCNLFLMGRGDRGLVRRGLTRVRELLDAGVNVAYASDNIRDLFNPFGSADMLQQALILAHAVQLGSLEEQRLVLEMGTKNPAAILGLQGYGLDPGSSASFIVLDDADWGSALAKVSPRRYIFSQGELVAETITEQRLI